MMTLRMFLLSAISPPPVPFGLLLNWIHGLAAVLTKPRQYDFHEVRLTSGAQRGLASRGQSRRVLSAHHERGGQP